MERIAVFVNDIDYARSLISPMVEHAGPTHWLVAACPPVLTRHAGRWLSRPARQAWVEQWGAELFSQLVPLFGAHSGSRVETMLIKRSVQAMAERLMRQHGTLRMLDARSLRLGRVNEALDGAEQPHPTLRRWTAPIAATAGLSSLLVLAD